jgi:hypothetical protein
MNRTVLSGTTGQENRHEGTRDSGANDTPKRGDGTVPGITERGIILQALTQPQELRNACCFAFVCRDTPWRGVFPRPRELERRW